MRNDRRDFLAKMAAGMALGIVAPSSVWAVGEKRGEKAKAKYPKLKCDVAVVGAGPGGVPAAIAAARQGAKVILLEEDNMPGGAPVDMYMRFSPSRSISGNDSGTEYSSYYRRKALFYIREDRQ